MTRHPDSKIQNKRGSGLNIAASDCTISGLVIDDFSGDGIDVSGGCDTITGNYIGIDPTGTMAMHNEIQGLEIDSSNNTIGGVAPGDRNVISGNHGNGILINGANPPGTIATPMLPEDGSDRFAQRLDFLLALRGWSVEPGVVGGATDGLTLKVGEAVNLAADRSYRERCCDPSDNSIVISGSEVSPLGQPFQHAEMAGFSRIS